MNASKKEATTEKTDNEQKDPKQKTCFVIMPIADHPDYAPGHFDRVYNHLIKPACEMAGYKTLRADDAKASHMIMFDILKKIVECDMAICDLSSKNANVFYELGLRQAFNRKTILITDSITKTPFDITGFRYVKYSESLRVDTVQSDTLEINAMLQETDSASDDDINSIVNLLRIQPATVNKIELNSHESILFELIKNLDNKVSRLSENKNKSNYTVNRTFAKPVAKSLGFFSGMSFLEIYSNYRSSLGALTFHDDETVLGQYSGKDEEDNFVFIHGDKHFVVENTLDNIRKILAM